MWAAIRPHVAKILIRIDGNHRDATCRGRHPVKTSQLTRPRRGARFCITKCDINKKSPPPLETCMAAHLSVTAPLRQPRADLQRVDRRERPIHAPTASCG